MVADQADLILPALYPPAFIFCLNDLTMMGYAVQQGRGHFLIVEHLRPFSEGQVCRYGHRGLFVQLGDKME